MSTAREAPGAVAPPHARLDSIDMVRGLAVVLMALDHTRDFVGASGQNPRDVADTAIFLTRWVTHFCAPTFILLAGVGAFLHGSRRSKGELSRYLLTRGLWIILVEFTLVRFGWNLNFDLGLFIAQVMWAIGASMIVLAALVQLPRAAVGAVGLVMIAGHNLLDPIRAEQFGAAAWVWNLLHQPALLHLGGESRLLLIYPLIPWPGVMALGYALGPLFRGEAGRRRRVLLGYGLAATAGFVLLRAVNLYGDPAPWSVQPTPLMTLLSFLDAEKYPPSLAYLLMTLGPALVLLALAEGWRGRLAGWLVTYGRVPFLFYVVHLPLIHLLAVLLAWAMVGEAGWLLGGFVPEKPPGYGLGIAGIYAAWIFVLVLLYPMCRWFAGLKQRRHDWWLSYL